MIFEEKTISTEKIFEGKMINLKVDTIKTFDDKEAKREIVEHPGAVAIVPVDKDGNIILVEQYRKPIEKVILEIPAGKIEEGEKPELSALRELKEETGYTAKKIKKIFDYYSSPGFSNEIIYLYGAYELEEGEQQLDENEFVEVKKYNIDELITMIKNGLIRDGKTIMGILSIENFIDDNQVL